MFYITYSYVIYLFFIRFGIVLLKCALVMRKRMLTYCKPKTKIYEKNYKLACIPFAIWALVHGTGNTN
jgi:hypothetical protein